MPKAEGGGLFRLAPLAGEDRLRVRKTEALAPNGGLTPDSE
jgi:hypothetical protein